MKPKTITIVGLGLMGGSLAATCKRRFPKAKIIAISRNSKALSYAKKRHWIDEGFRSIKSEISASDLVVVCTPVHVIVKNLVEIDRYVKPHTLVTDVGSVKGEMTREVMKRRWKNICFVGAHPMVGSHERGIEAVNPQLYDCGYAFLIRAKKTSPKAYKEAKQFWQTVSAEVIEVEAKVHDQITAAVSHLPHLVATALVLGLAPKNKRFVAKGFADTTRVAAGNPSIWLPILQANKTAVVEELRAFQRHLAQLETLLKAGDDRALRQILSKTSKKRSQISL